MQLATNQTGLVSRGTYKHTESFLPPVMQAIAYYVELLQYEPLYSTTVEPPFTLSTTPLTLPTFPSASTSQSPPKQPVTWWSPSSTTTTPKPIYSLTQPTTSSWYTTTTRKPSTWWSPPSTSTTQKPIWYAIN